MTGANLVKRIFLGTLLLLLIGSLIGCVQKDKRMIGPLVLTVDGEKVGLAEVKLYMLQIKAEFEQAAGETVWEIEDFSGGKTAIEVAKQGVLENIVRVKILNKKAKDTGIVLTEQMKTDIEAKALQYYSGLSKADIETYKITQELVTKVFEEFQIANDMMTSVTNDYTPSDTQIQEKLDENSEYVDLKSVDLESLFTQITVGHIYAQTVTQGDTDNPVSLSDEEKQDKWTNMVQALKEIKAGRDFESVVLDYSEEPENDQKGVTILSKARIEPAFSVLLNMKPGQVTDILDSGDGYHIFKVLDIKVPTETELKEYEVNYNNWLNDLKKTAVEDLKKAVFDKIYQEWKSNVEINVTASQWDAIQIK